MFTSLKQNPETLAQLPPSLEDINFHRDLDLSIWNSPSSSRHISFSVQKYTSYDQTEQQDVYLVPKPIL